MKGMFLKGVVVGAIVSMLTLAASVALAGTGIGGVFNLGVTNIVNNPTRLTGDSTAAAGEPQLQVTNQSSAAGATGIGISVAAGRPPLVVNSSTEVGNLNASLLGGRAASFFLPANGTAANSKLVGGLDKSKFWQLGGNAGTSPGTDFLGTSDSQALTFKVNGQQALLLQPNATSPNVIGGFSGNTVACVGTGCTPPVGATIGGGGTTGTGNSNSVEADFGTVAGGYGNTASGTEAVVAGGESNTASGPQSTASGNSNTASGNSSTAFGSTNTASGNYATAFGNSNSAGGMDSFAGGQSATVRALGTGAPDNNTFVWSDGSGGISSSGPNQFDVRAAGGFTFQTNASGSASGVQLAPGSGSWSSLSDVHSKMAIEPVSVRALLARLARVPIFEWSYKAQGPGVRHVGPMAQELYAAFGLGEDPRHIDTIDSEGLALAAIQGLYGQLRAQQLQIAGLQVQNRQLKHQQAQIDWLIRHAQQR